MQEHIDQHLSIEESVREPRAIYGPDDRKDLYQVTDPAILRLAESVVFIVMKSELVKQSDGSFRLQTMMLGKAFKLCNDQLFVGQPVAGFCSGFFITPSHIITAGHCLKGDMQDVYFITGFQMKNATTAVTTFQPRQIFSTVKIIRSYFDKQGTDYAIIKVQCLDSSNAGKPLSTPTIPLVDKGDSVFVIGHPTGLPLKYAPNSQVQSIDPISYFVANLDTFGGNSGSPVFNQQNQVVGILVRGETDYVPRAGANCNVAEKYPTTGWGGEQVQRITAVMGQVCDLSIELIIGDNGLYSDREVHVRLNKQAPAIVLPITHFDPNTQHNFSLDAEKMGIYCIEDIDCLEITSPMTQNRIFWDPWTLDRAIIKVNGGQELYNIAVNYTFPDSSSDNSWSQPITVIDDPRMRPYSDLRLFSASYSYGNTASITLNGSELGQWGRGMNVAVFDEQNGKLLQAATYDTNDWYQSYKAADSFAELLEGLPEGRIVAIAVMDEASHYLNDRAKKACKLIGSTSIDSLGWRQTWTIVGIKGAGSAAEALGYSESSSQLHYQLTTKDKYTGPGITVRSHSAGYEFGNTAFVVINGERVEHTYDRGLNVVLIDRFTGKVTQSKTFDTNGSEEAAGEFASFVEALPFGQIVAIAVMDEATASLTEGAREACRSIGSALIDTLGYRQSWAIVGIKGIVGHNCVSEALNPSGVTEVCSWFSM